MFSLVKSTFAPHRWRAIRRASNRMRWLLKLQLLRKYEFPLAQHPLRALQYVLWDPEVESYTYTMGNQAEYAEFLALLLRIDPMQVHAWLDEANTDRYLTRDRGFHWSSKRRLPLGNRLMWYPIVRALKPRVIVEAGIHEGLGSEMFLCALRRNGREGFPGRLISFDVYQDTGWLVHPDLRSNWQVVLEPTTTGLNRVLQDVRVDLFVHETPHTEELIRTELDAVMRHAGDRLAIIDSSGMSCQTLRDYCDRFNAHHYFFLDHPHDHIVKSHGIGLALFERERISQELRLIAAA
jgi:hypothetical protein